MSDRYRLRDLLPRAASQARCPQWIWNATVDPSLPSGVESLYNIVICEENLAQNDGLSGLIAVARLLREDLLDHRGAADSPIHSDLWCVLHLTTTLGPAALAVSQSEANAAYDWLLWSLTDSWAIDGNHDFHYEWLGSVLQASTDEAIDELIVPWLTSLYYYDWKASGLPDASRHLLPVAVALADAPWSDARAKLAQAMLSWGGTRHVGDDAMRRQLRTVADRMRSLAEDGGASAQVVQQALRTLASSSSSLTGENVRRRSAEYLERYGDRLPVTEKLEVLGNAFAGDAPAVLERMDEFLELVRLQAGEINLSGPGQANPAMARGAMISLISPPIVALARAGEADAVAKLLAAWHEVPNGTEASSRLLLGIHDRTDGITWVSQGNAPTGESTNATHHDFLAATNAFLGTTISSRDGDPLTLTVPDRGRGFPNQEEAARFADIATRFLSLGDAQRQRSAAEAAGSRLERMILLPTQPAPVQSLMLRDLGWTLPLTTSLRRPLPDRAVRRAAIWVGGALLADREREAVLSVLGGAGVDVIVRREIDMTRAQFLQDYARDDWDLFWVGVHGIFDALDPDDMHLHLAGGERIGAQDLVIDRVAATRRRLLVLNACDTGATALLGGLGEIGLATAAAGPAQAVICHLWPILSVTTAPVFATLLASELAEDTGFFTAYASTVSRLAAGSAAIEQALAGRVDTLIATVQDHEEDFANPMGWASSAFYE